MEKTPEWVARHKRKGTVIKKLGDNRWCLYSNTSRWDKERKKPMPVQKYIGKITEKGVVASVDINLTTPTLEVYEYGFSFALKSLFPENCYPVELGRSDGERIFLRMVRDLSPESYLLRGAGDLSDVKENLTMQMRKRFQATTGRNLESMLSLMAIHLVVFEDGTESLSVISESNRAVLSSLGISIP